MSSIAVDFDPMVRDELIRRLKQGVLSREEAQELMYILEKERKEALRKRDDDRATTLTFLLIGLDGYVHGNISLRDIMPSNTQ